MPTGFPPQPVFPLGIDSDRTLFLVHNTSETKTTKENSAWEEEIEIEPVRPDQEEIWADNGFANISGELFYYDAVEKTESIGSGAILGNIELNSNGGLKAVNVLNGGTGYYSPSIVVKGSGVGAKISAIINNGVIESIEIINPGQRYDLSSISFEFQGKVKKFKRCARNIGGKKTKFNPAGTWVRGFVLAEHHNQIVDTTIAVQKYIFSLEEQINKLENEPTCVDDAPCVEVLLETNIVEIENQSEICQGTTIDYEIIINGVFNSFNLDFGDGQSTDSIQSGTHTYAPGAKVDPVVTVVSQNCTVVQTPIERIDGDVPESPTEPTFVLPIPQVPAFPEIIIPEITDTPPQIELPQIIFPCLDVSPVGTIPSTISIVPPIPPNISIDFGPIPTVIPSITFGPIPLINPSITFGPIPLVNPSVTFGPIPLITPSITFGPIPIINPSITFGPIPMINPSIVFGPAPLVIGASFTFGPAPMINPSIVFGPAPLVIGASFTFGPAPEIKSVSFTFGPIPEIKPVSFTFGPAPEVKGASFTFSNAPEIKSASYVFGPAPEMKSASVTFGPAPEVKSASFTFSNAPEIKSASYVFGPAPEMKSASVTFGPAPEVKSASFTFSNAPEIKSASYVFGPAPEMKSASVTFGPAPDFSNEKINFGPAPEVKSASFSFGPAPDFSNEKINFGEAPDFTNQIINFGPAPEVKSASFSFGPAPDFSNQKINFGEAPDLSNMTIQFGPTPTINWGDPPTINIEWGSPPTISCVVAVECPSSSQGSAGFRRNMTLDDNFVDDFNTQDFDIEINDLGIPSEIKVVVPKFPEIKVQHDIPNFIDIKSDIPNKIVIYQADLMPREIKIINEAVLPTVIKVDAQDIPNSIKLDTSSLPGIISLIPVDIPSVIRLDGSEIPDVIQVVGIPDSIEVKMPSEIVAKLEVPKDLEIPLVYKGSPVPIQFDASNLLGGDEQNCFALVPCNKK